jgi:uncharacterized phage-associated protein
MPLPVHAIATEIRSRQPGIGTKKLHKLLYYCQGHHLAVHGVPLFAETIEAWDMGPVVAELWRAERRSDAPSAGVELGEAELNTIGYTLSRYGALTGKDLEVLSHGEDPWQEADAGRRRGEGAPMGHEQIARYFRDNAADDQLDPEQVAAWLADTATRPREPGPALTREELLDAFARTEARLGG